MKVMVTMVQSNLSPFWAR